jgi:hypothetical protein
LSSERGALLGPSRTTSPRTRRGAALIQLDPLWDELFPAEQARIVQLLVERVDVRMHSVEVHVRPYGIAVLVREVAGGCMTRATVSTDGETITVAPLEWQQQKTHVRLIT